MFYHLLAWLFIAAGPALAVCSIVIAFRRQYPPFLRFAPLATVLAYFVAGAIHFLVLGVAPFLVLPVACFGLYLAVRFLWQSSTLAYLFAGCSFVFWPVALFTFSQYLIAVYHHP